MANKTKDPKPTSERIQQLASRVLSGDIVLPEFQRQFAWSKRQVVHLLDSIYRNFPIGSLLVWESKQKLEAKRTIADLEVKERSENYPVNYLLDGQQRLSTICGVLYWDPNEGEDNSVWNVAFDLKQEKFIHLIKASDHLAHQIPIRWLSDPSTFYRKVTHLEDEILKERADTLFNRFMEYQVPLVTLGDMSLKDVGPIFERINSTGTKLTIFDLTRAATWSQEFDLGRTVETIKVAVRPKGFGGIEKKTILRALAASGGNDFSAESIDTLRHLSVEDLSSAADAVRESALRSVDFLATEIGAPRAEALPYSNQFAVLCEIFRQIPEPNHKQIEEIKRWFWGTTISGYFAGWDNAQMSQDAAAIRAWAHGRNPHIDVRLVLPTAHLWSQKPFRTNSAVSKMLGLLLGSGRPVDLLTGRVIDVDRSLAWSNDKEFHHFFPQAYCRESSPKMDSNRVGNIILLSSKSNISISDKAPSEYLSTLLEDVGREVLEKRLESNLVPPEALDYALDDDYEGFLGARGAHLHARVSDLSPEIFRTPGTTTSSASDLAEDIDDDSVA